MGRTRGRERHNKSTNMGQRGRRVQQFEWHNRRGQHACELAQERAESTHVVSRPVLVDAAFLDVAVFPSRVHFPLSRSGRR